MKRFVLVFLIFMLFSLSSTAAPKSQPGKQTNKERSQNAQAAPVGDAKIGAIKSENERCQECHGSHGQGLAKGQDEKFAKLAGQYPDYIIKQINDFRTGKRKHAVMEIMAKSIEDVDLIDIAAYFSSQEKMKGDGKSGDPAGQNLYTNGDGAREIIACVSCHGANGKGLVAGKVNYPVLGGQDVHYLEKQLIEWREGDRKNNADGIMHKVTKSLTDAEITALANYLASQSSP